MSSWTVGGRRVPRRTRRAAPISLATGWTTGRPVGTVGWRATPCWCGCGWTPRARPTIHSWWTPVGWRPSGRTRIGASWPSTRFASGSPTCRRWPTRPSTIGWWPPRPTARRGSRWRSTVRGPSPTRPRRLPAGRRRAQRRRSRNAQGPTRCGNRLETGRSPVPVRHPIQLAARPPRGPRPRRTRSPVADPGPRPTGPPAGGILLQPRPTAPFRSKKPACFKPRSPGLKEARCGATRSGCAPEIGSPIRCSYEGRRLRLNRTRCSIGSSN